MVRSDSDGAATDEATKSRVFLRTGKGKSAEIAAILERRIRSGSYPQGSRLPAERDLAAAFGVSRNTVRDAIGVLASRSLVETRWGSGTIVLEPDRSAKEITAKLTEAQHQWSNVLQLRDLVEPHIAELAARTATDADLLTLSDLIDKANPHMQPDESLRMDMAFHLAVARATGNSLIEALLEFVNDATKKERLETHETFASRRLSLEGHQRIFDRIRARDGMGAEDAMRHHLQEIGGSAVSTDASARA
mgnify:CR=1 FL=1